jgi:hypothetical protein
MIRGGCSGGWFLAIPDTFWNRKALREFDLLDLMGKGDILAQVLGELLALLVEA